MKTKQRGGEPVRKGVYLALKKGEFVSIPKDGGTLPGEAGQRYVRMPLPLVLALGPLAGAVYIIFLPFAGIMAVLLYLARKLELALARGATALVKVAVPSWMPGAAYLVRRQAAKKKAAREEAGETLTALEQEVRARREKEQNQDKEG